jgi:nicotinamidase-related amidase
MSKPHAWEDVIDDEIRRISANYAPRMGLGSRPALLCIDNYNAVFGDRAEPVLEAMARFPSSCGLAAWSAIEPTRGLMAAARRRGLPVIHSTRDSAPAGANAISSTKRKNKGADPAGDYAHVAALAPQPGELVIHKMRASVFFGTTLAASLVRLGVNTLVVCGNSTSGCVRASVNDAYMQGYRVGIVEECVFDRNWLSHKVNLFDMNAKYGDVMFVDEMLAYFESLELS